MNQTKFCNIRLSEKEFKELERLRIESGIHNRTRFIKKCIFGKVKPESKNEQKIKEQWKEVEQLLRRIKSETLSGD